MGTYLVTGTASGIGREVASQLIAAGSEVIGWDKSADGVAGGSHHSVDLSDDEAVEAAAAMLPEQLDGLINVAGVPGTASAETVFAVNLRGTRTVTDLTAPRIAAGGAVVTLASIAAYRCELDDEEIATLLDDLSADEAIEKFSLDGARAYDATKKALLAWNSRLVGRLLPLGIRACTVSPGPTQTPILGDFEQTMGSSVTRAEAALTRHATTREVAATAVFLAGPDASWVNGIDLRVDGGLMTLAQSSGTTGATR